MKSFVKRKIRVRILGKPEIPCLEGLRCSCSIVCDANQIQSTCDLTIWGLSMNQMNEWRTLKLDNRQIEVSVPTNDVDDGDVIYLGYIKQANVSVNVAPSAKPDEQLNTTKLDAEPNMGFYIHSTSAADIQSDLANPIQCKDERSAAKLLEEIAKKADLGFENPDIPIMLCDRTYEGSTLSQMEQVAKDANININIDLRVVRIWEHGQSTEKRKPHDISPKTGLIGYPTLTQTETKKVIDKKTGKKTDVKADAPKYTEIDITTGITCAMQLMPEILPGHIAKVTSSIEAAHAQWEITKVTHTFESENPNGKWFTEISGTEIKPPSKPPATTTLKPNEEKNDYNALRFIIQQLIKKIHTTTLVKVIAVTNNGGLTPVGSVDVQPLVNILDAAGNGHARGVLHNLPYLRIQGGKNAVIIDPEVGDIGMAGFCSRDISTVKRTRERSNPGSWATHSESDGLYLGGFLNGLPSQYVRFSGEGMELHSPTAITLSAPKVTIDAPTVNITGDVNVAGNLTNKDVNVGSTHVHGGVQPGSGNTGAPH